ncbi:MAG: hypothetical protein VX278_13360, partial [Myxococcota bacterium]|nr:hypothetical protein [Myxococcota bacterium]
WLAFPIVLWYTTARIRLLLGVLICTSPHWGMVLSEGGRFWDQSENILRGARMGAWERIWATLRFLRTPLALLGVLGLASKWSDWRSRALLLFGLFHCFAIAMVFPNERLLLPAILSFALGCCYLDVLWSSRRRTFLLLVVAAFLSYPSGARDARWPGLNDLSKKLAPYEGRIFSPSASIYRSSSEGIEGTIPFQAVASNPIVSVSLLQQYGKEHEIRYLLLNMDKKRRYPKFALLRTSDAEECFEEWCIFRLQSLSGTRLERLQKVE